MIDEHLNDDVTSDTYKSCGCSFLQLKCYCSNEFRRVCLLEHETNECFKRPYRCDVCNEFESTFEDVTTKHIKECPCGLVPCPSDCGISQRKNIDNHLATNCPLEMISCSFRYAGCEEKLLRKDMPAHISDSLAVHMSLQAVNYQKEIEKLKAKITELQTHLRIMPVTILLDGFASRKAAGGRWSSRPFYTHLRGYKLYLSVYCNGNRDGKGTHVSVYVHVMSGEHDYELEWPFHHSITVQLCDQEKGLKHYNHMINFGDAPEVEGLDLGDTG